ncbi:MAG TPA: hypothetical protein VE990_12180 [Acidimicrobiales bacterium]|nr:hypothetical protein [Acidimicrobiales bacterium]
MPRLTAADEQFVHQLPEPLPNVAVHHEHWRESYFFVLHPPTGEGDVVILTMAHFPARGEMDALQLGRVDGQFFYGRHQRPYGDDPHTTVVGPASVEIERPYRSVHLKVSEDPAAPVSLDLRFEARTQPYGLRRGTMKRADEIIWDQSHMIQSGFYSGTYTRGGTTVEVDRWWGQRDHSWGIRDHARCPMWMWLAIQLPDGMLGVWHWEYANGARVYTDGCFAPADGGEPVAVVDFDHELTWTDADGKPVSYERDGTEVRGLAGTVNFVLADGSAISVEGEGTWAIPYGPVGGGQHLMKVHTSDGRSGSAIYELTGAHHHRYFPIARAERLPPG